MDGYTSSVVFQFKSIWIRLSRCTDEASCVARARPFTVSPASDSRKLDKLHKRKEAKRERFDVCGTSNGAPFLSLLGIGSLKDAINR
jgi:hypothetical protein